MQCTSKTYRAGFSGWAGLFGVVVVLAAGAPGVWAQDRSGEPVHVVLSTNLPQAVVYADSLRLGTAGQEHFSVPATAAYLRLVAQSPDDWSVPPLEAALDAAPGDTVALRLNFPYTYKVESVPFGADVYAETAEGRRYLGETPLLYEQEAPLEGTLLVEKPGFAVERFEPGEEVWNRYALLMQPTEYAAEQAEEVDWKPPVERFTWVDYAAVGVALSAGVLAVHYKFKADRLYDRYQETTDPGLRPRIEALDTRAAFALGTMQVGVGLFALRLVLR